MDFIGRDKTAKNTQTLHHDTYIITVIIIDKINITIKSWISKLGQVRPVASGHKQRSQLHSSQELFHLCRWSRVSLQAVVLFVSRPFIGSDTTSLFQIPPLCFRYHLFVSNTTSLFQIPSLCFKYHLFASGTTSLTRKLWMLKNSKRPWKK